MTCFHWISRPLHTTLSSVSGTLWLISHDVCTCSLLGEMWLQRSVIPEQDGQVILTVESINWRLLNKTESQHTRKSKDLYHDMQNTKSIICESGSRQESGNQNNKNIKVWVRKWCFVLFFYSGSLWFRLLFKYYLNFPFQFTTACDLTGLKSRYWN